MADITREVLSAWCQRFMLDAELAMRQCTPEVFSDLRMRGLIDDSGKATEAGIALVSSYETFGRRHTDG